MALAKIIIFHAITRFYGIQVNEIIMKIYPGKYL